MALMRGSTGLDRGIITLTGIVIVGSITAMLDMTMITVALDGFTRAFDAPIGVVQWVSTVYLLTIAMVVPLSGRLVERFGARRMWLIALMVFMIGSALCSAAWSVGSLVAFRILQGVGGGMIVPLSMMILINAAGPERRGRVMALAAIPTQLAPILGPMIGGLIVDDLGWRWIFYVNVPICLLAIVPASRGIPDTPRDAGRRIDLIGLALLSPAVALLVAGLSRVGTSLAAVIVIVAGAILLAVFVVRALRVADPLIDVRLFTHRALGSASALNVMSRLSITGALILIPLYYQQVRGGTALSAGLLLAPQSLGTMIALPWVGKLTDRIGARPVVLGGISITILAALPYALVTAQTPEAVLAAALLVWGIGIAAVVVPVSAAAYQGLPPTAIPGATSAITMVQTLGASAGALILATILQSRLLAHPNAAGAAFAETFWWVLGFTALTLAPASLLPMPPKPEPTGQR